MFDLTGKCALVTGASGGIGGAIAKALHAQGAVVAISGTRVAPLEALAAELGERVHVLTCDLSRCGLGRGVAEGGGGSDGAVDILVNNAGITRDELFMRMSDEDWLSVLEVNLTSTFRLCRAVLRGMMKARWGRIVNISSVVGTTGNPGQANYAASKAGMVGMSKSLAARSGEPGDHGELRGAGLYRDGDDRQAERRPEGAHPGRHSRPAGWALREEIAAAVLYLASAEAGYITGATLHVNGGMTMI